MTIEGQHARAARDDQGSALPLGYSNQPLED